MIKYLRLGLFGGYKILFSSFRFRKFVKNKDKYSLKERYDYTHRFVLKMNKAFHFVPIVEGTENLPEGQCFITPNHQSVMDPVVLMDVLEKPISFVAKKEVSTYPFAGNILKAIDGKFIDRADLRSELKVFREMDQNMEKEKELSYVIFPEGTRSKKENGFELLSFHPGSFKPAMRKGLPIVPVCIYQTDRILNQDYHYRFYPVQVHFLKPILEEEYQDLSTAQVANLVHDRVYEELEKMKKQDVELIRKLNGYSEEKAIRVSK